MHWSWNVLWTVEYTNPLNKVKNVYFMVIYMSQSYYSAQQLLYPDIDDKNRKELEGKWVHYIIVINMLLSNSCNKAQKVKSILYVMNQGS